MSSITEVSERAGVSIATVSRVINKNPQVSPETTSVVRRAMTELGYTPPPPRRRTRGRPKETERTSGLQHGYIAFLFPDNREQAMRTALSGRFLQAITHTLAPRHINVIPTLLQENGDLPLCIRNGGVDGVIVRGSADVSPIAGALASIPTVWLLSLNTVPAHGDQVADDTELAGQMTADYFIKRGHKHVAVLNTDTTHACYQPRCDSFLRSFAGTGVTATAHYGLEVPPLMKAILSQSPRPTGVFIPLPDMDTAQAHREILRAGLQPGRDIDVVCCAYDPPRLELLDTRLSHLDIRAEDLAGAAVDMLLWRLQNPGQARRRLSLVPRLIEGHTPDGVALPVPAAW